jgi:hypothetical protein
MIREKYARLNQPVLIDLVVTPTIVSVQTWKEVSERDYELDTVLNQPVDGPWPERRLSFTEDIAPGQLPPIANGVYWSRLPVVSMTRPCLQGEVFGPQYAGRFFRACSYSLIDLDDPSIGAGEKTDAGVWVVGVDRNGVLSPFFNAIPYADAEKMHPMRAARNFGAPSAIFIYRPFGDMPFTECDITAKYNPALGMTSNVGNWVDIDPDHDYLASFDRNMPKVRVVEGGGDIATDEVGTVTIELVDADGNTIFRNCDLFLEETAGYLPHRRVRMVNGVGSFKVVPLHLTPNEQFKVKVGFRHYTGLLDVHFKVV